MKPKSKGVASHPSPAGTESTASQDRGEIGERKVAKTLTQLRILRVMDAFAFQAPRQISESAGIDNWGGTARSLRCLLAAGVVEQKLIGKQGRWPLYGYRINQVGEKAAGGAR